jgi:hypothetical protein
MVFMKRAGLVALCSLVGGCSINLSESFVKFAQLGASWVLWLLIGLSVISIGVMIDRFMWFRGRDTDTDRFTRELRGAFERGELDRIGAK